MDKGAIFLNNSVGKQGCFFCFTLLFLSLVNLGFCRQELEHNPVTGLWNYVSKDTGDLRVGLFGEELQYNERTGAWVYAGQGFIPENTEPSLYNESIAVNHPEATSGDTLERNPLLKGEDLQIADIKVFLSQPKAPAYLSNLLKGLSK